MGQWTITGGKIWRKGHLEKNSHFTIDVENDNNRIIDLGSEDILIPGYYDIHCHIWGQRNAYGLGSIISISPDHLLSTGIVACADAGSYGYKDWEEANRSWNFSPITVKSWINLIPESLTTPGIPYTQADQVDKEKLVDIYDHNKDHLIGFKFIHGLLKKPEEERAYLEMAAELGERTGARLMVHMTGSSLPIQETIHYLKPGDIMSHIFNDGRPGGIILDEKGEVIPEVIQAQKDGILLESSSAFRHFSFRPFFAAQKIGLNADIIATDNNLRDYRKQPLFDITHFLTKMVAGGMDLEKALAAAIDKPCEIMGLSTAYDKNVVVLRHQKGSFTFQDTTLKDPEPIVITSDFNYQVEYGVYSNYCVFTRNNEL